MEWDATTIVVVEAEAAGRRGLGYTYADASAARLIRSRLADAVLGGDAWDAAAAFERMRAAVRNVGRPGIAACAISAVDVALWDLKARLLGVPLAALLGRARERVPAYGSGGFTSYDLDRLERQLGGWAAQGFRAVKMKVGRRPDEDPRRVRAARRAIGDQTELFVDANGAYGVKQALALAREFAESGVTWLEEPVPQDDAAGLADVRARAPAGLEIASGEYAWTLADFRILLEADAVDVLQADATRCGGVTGFLAANALAEAWRRPLSSHTAPSLHAVLGCAAGRVRNVEWFHDHARLEALFFDGAPKPSDGCLAPDLSRPGLGLELKRPDVERYHVAGA